MTSVLTLPSHMSGFLHELGSHSGVYSYVSKPTLLVTNKPKFKAQMNGKPPNIMIDRRVVRGNTYSHFRNQIFNMAAKQKVTPTDGTFLRRKENNNSNSLFNNNKKGPDKTVRRGFPEIEDAFYRPTSPTRLPAPRPFMNGGPVNKLPLKLPSTVSGGLLSPLPGRRHTQLQTEKWLEEITDKVAETHTGVQTDPIYKELNRSMTEEVVPGVDKQTQVYANDPEIFNFDKEVGVLLEAVLGRTLEQSILEILEEEETYYLMKQKADHQAQMSAMAV